MKVQKILFGLGVVAAMFIVAVNLQYAIGDYGIRTNNLHSEILAQATSAGTAGGTNGGDNWWNSKVYECKNDLTCKEKVYCAKDINGNWGIKGELSFTKWVLGLEVGYYFSYSETSITLNGLKERCKEGNELAHCWPLLTCSSVCAIPNSDIIAAIAALPR